MASAPIVSLPVPWPSECSRADSVKPVQEEGGGGVEEVGTRG